MYIFESRVRYSETDETGCLSLLGMINYMQDCSTFQSEDRQVGVRFLEEHHRAWLLAAWRIFIDRRPALGERILVGTWPTFVKGIYGHRNFVLRTAEGESLIRAESRWFLYDTQKNCPVRVRPEDVAPYGPEEPALVMEPVRGRAEIPRTWEQAASGQEILVERHHLDTNHHVNNAQYVDMARDALPQDLVIREIRAEYKRAALLGDILIPRVIGAEKEWTVFLTGADGGVYAAVWFRAA